MKKHGFKKLLAGLSAACVIGSALPAMSFAAETELSKTLGDSNGDGVVELINDFSNSLLFLFEYFFARQTIHLPKINALPVSAGRA